MTARVYHARFVLPISSPPITGGAVAVAGDRITWVGRAGDAPAGEQVQLGDAVLMPGLVNVHAHLELTAMRGFLEDLAFRPWILRLTHTRQAVMTRERRVASARLGLAEGLLSGVTTYADVSDTGDSLAAMREMQVRGVVFHEVFGPHAAQCDAAMAELQARVTAARREATALVTVGISPHAPYTVSDALFRACASYARQDGLPVTVHIAESAAEDDLVVRGSGVFAEAWRARGIEVAPRAASPVDLLRATGVLDTEPLVVHAVRATTRDLEVLRAHGARLAHCPASNAKLGHGVAPLVEALDLGIPTGLGSDSVASGNRMDLLDDARLAILQQRARLGRADRPTASDLVHAATLGGATALGMARTVGSLEVGKAADLVAFPLDPLRDGPVHDPVATLVFAAAGRRARLVTVAGVELVRDGTLREDMRGDLATTAGTAAALSQVEAREH